MADLDSMTRDDLARERAAAESRLKEIQKAEAEYDGRRLKALRSDIEKRLAEEGFTMADLMDGRQKGKRGSAGAVKAPAKYRHPENHSLTWSGRGRRPAWFTEALDGGMSKEDLAV
jgi:DNA-binding protein H-NS